MRAAYNKFKEIFQKDNGKRLAIVKGTSNEIPRSIGDVQKEIRQIVMTLLDKAED